MKKSFVIIAEAGVNHNGNLQMAKELVQMAAKCGADYVKFQTFKADRLVTESAPKADYQIQNQDKEQGSQIDMLKRLELSNTDHVELLAECERHSIKFLSTGFDVESIEYLIDLGIELIKIPSGEVTNFPLLSYVGSKNMPTVLSTGMSTLQEVKQAAKVLFDHGLDKAKLTVLHCNTEYPTPMDDVNLRAMLTIKNELQVDIGYSDHTTGIEVAIASVAMGASIIEKHFTLDKSLPGPDHRASLEPDELCKMISSIRNIEKALGSPIKIPSPSEEKNKVVARKSIVASKDIQEGELFSPSNLTTKRPGDGVSPMRWNEYVGKKSDRSYTKDERIE
jgi:N,N'-diacetyllegionaminate synthase